jgi:hypothetical protein
MSIADSNWKTLEATCRTLASGVGALGLSWSWDARLGAALATFSAGQAEAVSSIVQQGLGLRFDYATLAEAHPAVRARAAAIGGLRPGQWLAACEADTGALAAAAWWPWNGGQTISMRVFPVVASADRTEIETLSAAFRGWFGV